MINRNDTDTKTVLISILAGVAAGLTVGVLLAPKSGEDLRADIGKSVDDYLETARQKADELKNSATNLAQKGLREVQKTKDSAMAKFDSAVSRGADQAQTAVDNADAALTGTRG